MQNKHFFIDDIPSILWGDESSPLFIAVHGSMSFKDDEAIAVFAKAAQSKGYSTLSFDLPAHGERADGSPLMVNAAVQDLIRVLAYAKEHAAVAGIFACSLGAYLSLLAYAGETFSQCFFLSPIVNMKRIIDTMMKNSRVTPEELKEKKIIPISDGQFLIWDYYNYVCEHSIEKWNTPTNILYGERDELCDHTQLRQFADKYGCRLDIAAKCEHYFHSPGQLATLLWWLEKAIR